MLEVAPVLEKLELVATSVADCLKGSPYTAEIGVAEIGPALSDTTAFCERYEIPPSQAANCVVLEASRADRRWFAGCVILGSTRADVNGVARKFLGARRASFAPMEEAVSLTGMEYGAITPFGLPHECPILVDAAVAATDRVIVGSGSRKSKLLVPGSLLATLPNSTVLDGLAR